MSNVKIDHIIAGVGRCGTTTLSSYLEAHPQLNYSNIKELHFFSLEDQYRQGESFLKFHYENRPGLKSTCDTYLFLSDEGFKRLKSHNPNVKITLILRNPIERTISSYKYAINNGYLGQNTSVSEAVEKEQAFDTDNIVQKTNHGHALGSMYSERLKFIYSIFDESQIQVLRTKDLQANPQEVVNEVSSFLEVESYKIEEKGVTNRAAGSKSKSLQQFLVNRDHWLRKIVRYPLKVKWLKKMILKSGMNEGLKKMNQKESNKEINIGEKDKAFLDEFFSSELELLKEKYQLEF